MTESFDYSYWSGPVRRFVRILGWPRRNQRAITETLQRLKAFAENQVAAD